MFTIKLKQNKTKKQNKNKTKGAIKHRIKHKYFVLKKIATYITFIIFKIQFQIKGRQDIHNS